ncbi:asparagine synthase [Caulobacter sp. FWC26]|jgi:asparagine synthase (glutamine-hydrolysing)|uniref:asparagine synthase-related protein n=1 Tax=Caulobacter sp. CCH9-E1 TaxID=1768768 RepID=UPI0009EBDD19|nr:MULTISPECIES: asparagine synthase C-terminal domain-containing protein [unclassified Caulobacter]AZS21754.1 asparagine synthase [Caulobacter sp. FWC26]
MGYIVLVRTPGATAAAFDAMLEDLVARQGWRHVVKAYALAVLVKGAAPLPVLPLAGAHGVGGVLLGRVFDRAAGEAGEARQPQLDGLVDLDPIEAVSRLIQSAWGGYVAVLAPRRPDPPVVLRDPTGQVEAFIWRRDGVTLIGSEAPRGLAAPLGLAIDWRRVGDLLDDPRRTGAAPPLSGVLGVDPGECRHGVGAGESLRLWSPARIVRERRPPDDPADALRRWVDVSVAAEASDAETMLCEISGGLDSAIVATALARAGRRPTGAINFYRDQAQGDERLWARAVADAIGVPLTTVQRSPFALASDDFAFGATGLRPSLNALDPEYDRLLLAEAERLKAQVLFTGHGGDVVFYQLGAAEIAADILQGAVTEDGRLRALGDVARRTRRSVWSLARQAFWGRRPTEGAASRERFVVHAARGVAHPWLDDLQGLAPAKRVQVAGLVNSLNVVARTRRGAVTRLAHPLLGQPMVELCLSIPAPILSAGEGDRRLARRAFSDRLPALVAERRSKGDITVFFGKSIAASLPTLRPMLLDGRLVAEGLIDKARLEAALRPETLVWKDFYGEILVAAALEAWVRHWEGRIAEGDGETVAGVGAPPGVAGARADPGRAASRNANTRA